MILAMDPHSSEEIQAELARVDRVVTEYFDAIPAEPFFAHPPQVWSPAENLAHLVKAVKPVAQALRLPKLVPQMLFGEAAGGSRNFAELVAAYKGLLAAGGVSPTQFVPELAEPGPDLAAAKAEVLRRWQATAQKLEAALPTWSDADLDRYRLPHPLLGKITVRELMFFTLYHNLHHVNDVRALLGEAALEI
jgi:hypothetical protein